MTVQYQHCCTCTISGHGYHATPPQPISPSMSRPCAARGITLSGLPTAMLVLLSGVHGAPIFLPRELLRIAIGLAGPTPIAQFPTASTWALSIFVVRREGIDSLASCCSSSRKRTERRKRKGKRWSDLRRCSRGGSIYTPAT